MSPRRAKPIQGGRPFAHFDQRASAKRTREDGRKDFALVDLSNYAEAYQWFDWTDM